MCFVRSNTKARVHTHPDAHILHFLSKPIVAWYCRVINANAVIYPSLKWKDYGSIWCTSIGCAHNSWLFVYSSCWTIHPSSCTRTPPTPPLINITNTKYAYTTILFFTNHHPGILSFFVHALSVSLLNTPTEWHWGCIRLNRVCVYLHLPMCVCFGLTHFLCLARLVLLSAVLCC